MRHFKKDLNHMTNKYGIEGLEVIGEASPAQNNYGIEGLEIVGTPPTVNEAPEAQAGGFMESFARPAARAAKSAAQGLVGEPADLVNNAIASPLAHAVGAGASALGFDNFAEGAHGFADRLSNPATSASHQIEQGFSNATGGLTDARNATERVVDKAGEFLSGGALFNAGKLAGFGIESVKDIGRFAGAGALGQGAKEMGANFGGELVATIFGDIIGGNVVKGGANIAKGVAKAIKSPQELGQVFSKTVQAVLDAPYEIVGSLFRVAPQNVKKEVMQAAKELDIEAPLSLKVKNPLITFAESNFTKSAIAGDQYKKLLSEMNESVVDTFKTALDKVHPERLSQLDAGKQFQGALENVVTDIKDASRELYLKVEKTLPEGASWRPTRTLERIAEIKNKFNTAAPSTDELYVVKKIKEIESELFSNKTAFDSGEHLGLNETISRSFPENGEAQVARISGTRRSLNDTINWELNADGPKNLLKAVSESLMKDLEEYSAAKNPDFIIGYKNANAFYKNKIAEGIRNDLIKSISNENVPESIIKKINTESAIIEVEKIIGDDKKAREAFDAIKRVKLEEILTDNIIGPDGSVYYGVAANKLNDKTLDPFLKRLLDTANPEDKLYDKFKSLRTFVTEVSKSGKEFYNPSATATIGFEIARYSGFMSSLFTANPMIIGSAGLTMLSPRIVTKLITDKRFMDSVTKYIHLDPQKTPPSKLNSVGRSFMMRAEEIARAENGDE
jgi:hypothetical protein